MRMRTTFLWLMIGSLSLAAAMGVLAIVTPGFGGNEEDVLGTALLVGAFSILALACSIVLGRGRLRAAMWFGIVTSGLALAIWLTEIWFHPWRWWDDSDKWVIRLGVLFTTAAVWAAHLGLLALPRIDRPASRLVRVVTLTLAGALAILGNACVWLDWDDEWATRTIGVLSVLTACGTVVSPVLALIEFIARRGGRESVPSRLILSITCPRCGKAQQLAAGPGRCAGCGLRINIDIEEPRCSCGYLLYQLKGDACPECGRSIPKEDRWAAR